ncbi:MAG: uroporphyrinogen-III synthase [Hyphomicrobiaceae bacterium]|nr:uroporphyrinogen-III synthase [Hyphomicrobiaceae bacterium]
MRLLVTRPQPDADAQAVILEELGHEAVIAPLLAVEVRDPGPIPIAGTQALVVTSRNALRAFEELGQVKAVTHLPLVAVGEATARLAEETGFQNVAEGPGTAEALVPLICGQCDPSKGVLAYLTGEKTAFDLRAPLESHGFEVAQMVLYATHPVDALDPSVVEEIRSGRLDGVILMSPATAATYTRLVQKSDLAEPAKKLVHLCLSANVAEALSGLAGARSSVASAPTQDDLLALITREAANC